MRIVATPCPRGQMHPTVQFRITGTYDGKMDLATVIGETVLASMREAEKLGHDHERPSFCVVVTLEG